MVSLSLPHDLLWTSPKPQVLPPLRYWTSPNVVLGILSNAKWAVAKCCRKAERLGGPREYQIPPSHKNRKYVSGMGRSFVSCPVSYNPLQHDPPQLVLMHHTWLLNQVSCCPCHCSAVSPGHSTCAPASDGHMPMVHGREGDACQMFIFRSPLRHHCLQW